MNDPDFILRVLKAYDPFDCDDLLWKFDDGAIRFFAACNDTFWWATADCEEITPENIGLLEQAKTDSAACGPHGRLYGDILFASRVRKMRPMKAAYPKQCRELWPLFDACGPERADDATSLPN